MRHMMPRCAHLKSTDSMLFQLWMQYFLHIVSHLLLCATNTPGYHHRFSVSMVGPLSAHQEHWAYLTANSKAAFMLSQHAYQKKEDNERQEHVLGRTMGGESTAW